MSVWLFQTERVGDQGLFYVESALFTTPGSLPDGCWFWRVFGGTTRRPDPIDERNGVPIYALPIPAPVFAEMLHVMRFQALLPAYYEDMPASLDGIVTFDTWRAYLTHYLVGATDLKTLKRAREEGSGDDGEDSDSPERKKARLGPTSVFAQRVARALADVIRAEHPGWNAFHSGAERVLRCTFVSTYRPGGPNGVIRYTLPVPGEPVVEPVTLAHYLGHVISTGPNHGLFLETLIASLGLPSTMHAQCYLTRKRKSKAKTAEPASEWPTASAVDLAPGYHDVVRLVIH